ncbi:MAG: hypothetical protein GY832_47465 [Chloroflexi bacterium]|nr:hypothetical protein [Chloroflexota bacterium]
MVVEQEIQVISREWQEYEKQSADNGDMFWEWEGVRAARYDTVTGTGVGSKYDSKSFYTGIGVAHQ